MTTAESADTLLSRADALEQQAYALQRQARDLRREADQVRLEHERPSSFPTSSQRIGIDAAIDRWRDGYKPESRHGDPMGPPSHPYAVTLGEVRGAGWLSIRHGSPIAAAGGGGRLWRFTDADVQEILDVIAAHGVAILDHWTHDQGVSVRIKELP